MRVLITGGSGFMGTNLVSFYLERGVEVCNLDIVPPRNKEHLNVWKNLNLMDFEKLQEEIQNFSPTHIFHLAAKTGLNEKDLRVFAPNYQGVENLILACQSLPNLERIIFTSTMLVCRPDYKPKNSEDYCPTTLYGESKVMGEKVVKNNAKNLSCYWSIVRPVGIWGPWFGTPYKEFFQTIAKGLYVLPGRVGAKQSLGFIGNTVYQYHTIATAPASLTHGKTFYLGDFPPTDMHEFAKLISKAFGRAYLPTVPIWLLKGVAKVGDISKIFGWKNPLLTSFRLKNLMMDMVYEIDPLISENLPYTLEEGVKMTVEWLSGKTKLINELK